MIDTRDCTGCHVAKPLTSEHFALREDDASGKLRFASRCRKCHARIARQRHERRRRPELYAPRQEPDFEFDCPVILALAAPMACQHDGPVRSPYVRAQKW